MKRTELYKLLQSAGLHSQYLGYEYFADAVWLAAKDPARLHNMRRDIYLPVAALHQVSCSSVERDIRTIRDVLYRHTPADFFRSLGLPPLWQHSQPYPRECIALFADYPGQASLTCPDFLSYNRVSADSAIPLQEKMLRN